MKILIATHNPGKLQEIKDALKNLEKKGIKILSLKELNIKKEPKETGKTLKENAELKARFYSKLTELPTIADDAGLIIPYLNNEPGVKSRRWPGYPASDEELIEYTLKKLKGVPLPKRKAYLKTCVCFYDPKIEKAFFQCEKIKGYIAEKPCKKLIKGYPFRSLFIVEKYNKYYGELTEEEHEEVNHRKRAVKNLFLKLKTEKILNSKH